MQVVVIDKSVVQSKRKGTEVDGTGVSLVVFVKKKKVELAEIAVEIVALE